MARSPGETHYGVRLMRLGEIVIDRAIQDQFDNSNHGLPVFPRDGLFIGSDPGRLHLKHLIFQRVQRTARRCKRLAGGRAMLLLHYPR